MGVVVDCSGRSDCRVGVGNLVAVVDIRFVHVGKPLWVGNPWPASDLRDGGDLDSCRSNHRNVSWVDLQMKKPWFFFFSSLSIISSERDKGERDREFLRG